jgi:hypothetical protein
MQFQGVVGVTVARTYGKRGEKGKGNNAEG